MVGSTSLPGHPTDNSVVERWFRTFKLQYLEHPQTKKSFVLSDVVPTTKKLQKLVDDKVHFLNTECQFEYNHGMTCIEHIAAYDHYTKNTQQNEEKLEPTIITAAITNIEPQADDEQIVRAFRNGIRHNLPPNKLYGELSAAQNAEYMKQQIAVVTDHVVDLKTEQSDKFAIMEYKLDQIQTHLKKKPRVKRNPDEQRDRISFTMFHHMLYSQKPPNVHKLSWSRFRIACVILYFTGLRANEVAYTTKEMIDSLINNKKGQFFQSKVNKLRVC